MRVVLRADAGFEQGTGHVMRCLTLAEELVNRGHEVHLMVAPIPVPWLRASVLDSGLTIHECAADEIPDDAIRALDTDWLIVDSYRIPAKAISRINAEVRVLAIIDGDDRSIDATLYLDQNLGSERISRPLDRTDRYLCGSDYALVRHAVRSARQDLPWQLPNDEPNVLCFMGGTDPTGSVIGAVRSLSRAAGDIALTVVAPEIYHERLRLEGAAAPGMKILPPTRELPMLMSQAEVIVSAAGTSAWDICTLGVPAVLVAVVENQRVSLREILNRRLALGIDLTREGGAAIEQTGLLVTRLIESPALREQLSRASRAAFDGRGCERVVSALEQRTPSRVDEANSAIHR